MTETTNLYLLIFPEHSVVKIGKANDIFLRGRMLRRWWGEADYSASYYLAASQNVIFKLEKSLHFLLSHYVVPFTEGDGKTELFSIDALDIALKHIDLYCSSESVSAKVKKGIPLPVPTSKRQPRHNNKHAVLFRKTKAMTCGVTQIAEQFSNINRLLIFLLRKQTRIAYQYDIIDNKVYFRLIVPNGIRSKTSSDIMRYFSFDIEDFNGICGINCCTVTGVDDVIQFNIRLPSADDQDPWQGLLSYFWFQSERLLKKLPHLSSAATSEIPLLDESEVLNEIFSGYEGCLL